MIGSRAVRGQKPPFSYVQSGPTPARAGPSKRAWEETAARLDAAEQKERAASARRRAERFVENFKKLHSRGFK